MIVLLSVPSTKPFVCARGSVSFFQNRRLCGDEIDGLLFCLGAASEFNSAQQSVIDLCDVCLFIMPAVCFFPMR